LASFGATVVKLAAGSTAQGGDDRAAQAELARRLADADLLIESAPASFLLDRSSLAERYPRLIIGSLTPFGRSGPYAEYRGGELVCSAMGGVLRLVGYPDRAPVKEALDACVFHAEAAAAAGLMIALCERTRSGLGQHVDVSIQEVAASRLTNGIVLWQFDRRQLARSGNHLSYGRAIVRCIWELRDGYAFHSLMSGRFGAPANAALSRWLDDSGFENPLREVDWLAYDRSALPAETRAIWERALDRFFRSRTKQQIADEGRRRGINAAVVHEPSDVLADEQLAARGFLQPQRQPDGHSCLAPSYFVKTEPGGSRGEKEQGVGPVVSGEQPGSLGVEVPHAQPLDSPSCASAPFREDPRLPTSERAASGGRDHAGASAPPHEDAGLAAGERAADGGRGHAGRMTARGALAGLKVLDFSWALVGSVTTKALADHGAQVVKVESSRRPCLSRVDVQVACSTRTSFDDKPWFAQLNTSKSSLRLDIKHPRAWEVLGPLVDWADLVVENFSPGTLQKVGLDYTSLQRRRPDLIMISASAYGQTGPLAQGWGVDGTSAALSGRVSLTGWPDRAPVTPGALPYADLVVPQLMVAAIGAALAERSRSSTGRYIDAAMYEISVQQMRQSLIAAQLGEVLHRRGNRDARVLLQGVYPTRGTDRWLALTLFDASDWSRFTAFAGGEWPDARTVQAADEAMLDEVDQRIGTITSQHADFELMQRLQAAGLAAGALQDASDLLERDPQLRARGAFVSLNHPILGTFDHQSTPFHLARTPEDLRSAPLLGEHDERICRKVLGLSAEAYASLAAAQLFV
jgi:crotonobetainyl-CoA:carnitine CoA-transferase CaiB-like acyl-CoA transferase